MLRAARKDSISSGELESSCTNARAHKSKGACMIEGSVAEMAEQLSGVTGVRSLLATPSRCGRVTSVLNSLVG